jgi:hypothetical protein
MLSPAPGTVVEIKGRSYTCEDRTADKYGYQLRQGRELPARSCWLGNCKNTHHLFPADARSILNGRFDLDIDPPTVSAAYDHRHPPARSNRDRFGSQRQPFHGRGPSLRGVDGCWPGFHSTAAASAGHVNLWHQVAHGFRFTTEIRSSADKGWRYDQPDGPRRDGPVSI